MEYTTGYVAFLDILGFSTFVSKEENGPQTADLFEFVRKFCYLFNTSPNLNIEASFFSDSIVLSANKLEALYHPILIAESYLRSKLHLLFRGGIAYGKYYHKSGVTFGPAVIQAYNLEKKAVYSRILVDNEINVSENDKMYYFKDIDGYTCVNPTAFVMHEIEAYGEDGIHYPEEDIVDALKIKIVEYRTKILSGIRQYIGSPVVEKYLWRVRSFNYTCKLFSEIPSGTLIYKEIDYKADDNFKTMFASQIIEERDINNIN